MLKKIVHSSLISLLLALGVGVAAVALVPEWRNRVQSLMRGEERTVLSTVRGKFIENEEPLKAVKAMDETGVFVEVFRETSDGSLEMIARIVTGDPFDGQFNFKGQISSLVSSDIDGDGVDELLVPTFNHLHQPRLNVFKYQPDMKLFQTITPPSARD